MALFDESIIGDVIQKMQGVNHVIQPIILLKAILIELRVQNKRTATQEPNPEIQKEAQNALDALFVPKKEGE